MANIISQASGAFSAFSWASMGQILFIAVLFIAVISLFVITFFLLWWKSYNTKVTIYEPFGQVPLSEEEIKDIYKESKDGKIKTLKEKNIKFDLIRTKRTHGKHTTKKGTPFFSLFMPFKNIEPVPMELMFNDGIHLLRLSKEVLIPIPKPNTIINVGGTVSISVADNNKWMLWNNMMAERVNAKYQDIDAQKKAILYFVIGIAGMVIIGALILWLIYASATKGMNIADKLGGVVDKVNSGAVPT